MKTIIILCSLLACTLATKAAPRALYLAPRSDAKAGSGTITDPYNASNAARLWQAWRKTAFRTDGLSGQTIVFLPGVYYCTNELRLPGIARDVILTGYGARVVYGDKALEGQRTILCTAWDGNEDVTIEGFTLDCGSEVDFKGSGKVGGVFSRGRNNVVRDVTIRNLAVNNKAPFATAHESFGIVLYSDGGIASGNVIAGTSAGEAQVVTGMAVSGNDCTVNGNVVDFRDPSPTNNLTSFGYSLYGSRLLLSGNVARGVDAAVSMDASGAGEPNTWRDNVIVGNQFSANQMVVRIENNTQSYKHWLWVGNNFHANGRRWLSMWTNPERWMSNKISDHRFVANLFTGDAQQENLLLANFLEPHGFVANSFTEVPRINTRTNANDIYGLGNTVQGTLNDRPFGAR